MTGKPVIRGTRITVELLLQKLGEGLSEKDLLDAYPQLTKSDIRAAIAFAADVIAHEELEPLQPQAPSVSPSSTPKFVDLLHAVSGR